jgi:hypothetical protein
MKIREYFIHILALILVGLGATISWEIFNVEHSTGYY